MRRRWCIPVATLALVGGSVLAASAAAAATAAPRSGHVTMRSGGTAAHLTTPLTATTRTKGTVTSTNWSGYAVHSGTYTSVSASWVEPTGHCPSSGSQYSSFWIGLDGYSSRSVEQTGSEVDCHSGTPKYYAWYEMYPKGSVNLHDPVKPGDQFTGSVTYDGSGKFTLKLTDTTQGWTATENKTLTTAKRSSAEVIIEAPCCTATGGILPLADFGTINLSSSQVDGSSIGSLNPTKIIMESKSTKEDSVSNLTDGTNFSATWLHS
jgi:hypothetical protein